MTKTERAIADALRSVRIPTSDRRLIAEALVDALDVTDHEDFILLAEGTSDLLAPKGLIGDESDQTPRGAFAGQPAPWRKRDKDAEETAQSKGPAALESDNLKGNEVATPAHKQDKAKE